MLEQMRKSSRSLLIYVLFLTLIAVFIINFGPQSRGGSCESTMPGNDHFAAKVAGDMVSANDFRYGFLLLGGAQVPMQVAKQQRLKETVMDKLIERELLAQEAERLGYAVTDDQVEDLIADSKIIGLGYPRSVPRMQKDGKFSYEAFKNFVQFELGVTPKSFIEEQKRELLASRVRDLMRGSVTVSPEEVKSEFMRRGRQVNLEYVRFPTRRYEADIAPTEAEIADYAAKNDAQLRKTYDEQKFLYEKTPKELRLRQILVKTPEDGDDKAGHQQGVSGDAEELLSVEVRKNQAVFTGQCGGGVEHRYGSNRCRTCSAFECREFFEHEIPRIDACQTLLVRRCVLGR